LRQIVREFLFQPTARHTLQRFYHFGTAYFGGITMYRCT
jgi:hypothetical protein